jgi:hypothetical protein
MSSDGSEIRVYTTYLRTSLQVLRILLFSVQRHKLSTK